MADHESSRRVAARFTELVEQRRLGVPLPGEGATAQRWRALAELAADDLDVARLAEAHLDALAIQHELHVPHTGLRGQRWAVWAAEPPNGRVEAEHAGEGGWRLTGVKRWCSGAHACTHALVTAHAADGGRLFAVDLSGSGVHPGLGGWKGLGMAGSGTEDVAFDAVPAVPVGAGRCPAGVPGPGGFLVRRDRRGRVLVRRSGRDRPAAVAGGPGRELDPHARAHHARAHLGAVDSALAAAGSVLQEAAAAADRAGDAAASDAPSLQLWRRRALRVRAVVEAVATMTIERVGRALGPRPLATDAAHSRRVADLGVYLRQSHAERDLAVLGDLAANADRWQPW